MELRGVPDPVDGPGDDSDWDDDFEEDDEPSSGRYMVAVREILANQIAAEDPPEVWLTAQRLLAEGLDRRDVMRNLAEALDSQIHSTIQVKQRFDVDRYRRALDRLPVPSGFQVEQVILDVVRHLQPVPLP